MARSINAMVIDDSGMTRKLVMKALTATGLADFSFIEANDGLDALEKFKPGEVDILFVDMQMPRLDGVEFLRKLHATHTSYPPAVMVTSENTREGVLRAKQVGVDAFMLKPVDIDRLRTGIQKLLDCLPDRSGPCTVPHGEVVPVAFQEAIESMCGFRPQQTDEDADAHDGAIVFGSISVLGSVQWSVVLGFQQAAAAKIASAFAGFDIPADSEDLGDAIGELANITAGLIQRKLATRNVVIDISLPVVWSASSIKSLIRRNTTCDHVHFQCDAGKLWSTVTVGMNPGIVM